MRFHFALAVLAALGLLTRSIEAADYNYPYRDPYLATATSAILGNDEATARVESNVLRVPGLPGRNKLPSLEGRGDLSLAFYRQNQGGAVALHSRRRGIQPLLRGRPVFSELVLSSGLPCGHLAVSAELEFCVVGQHQRRAGLRSSRRARFI